MRKAVDYISVSLKGIAMGAADVVPGVSGGTIAFISGIYEELINSIKSLDISALKLLFSGKFGQFWTKINGNFLAALLLGIGISIFSLAGLMTWLLKHEPIGTWSFFFGLIVASSILVSRDVKKWNWAAVVSLLAGVAAGYAITVIAPSTTPQVWWFTIIAGAIAICAMILPGISGSFILLLMGQYPYIMSAVSGLKFDVLAFFAIGAVAGIVSFSHVLSWLLSKYRNATIALLTGFMIGSLNKVWPWKEVLQTYTDSHGEVHTLTDRSVLPQTFESLTGASSQIWQAVALCAAGFLLIWVIDLISKRKARTRPTEN